MSKQVLFEIWSYEEEQTTNELPEEESKKVQTTASLLVSKLSSFRKMPPANKK